MNDYSERLELIRKDIIDEISLFSGCFSEFKPELGYKVHFTDESGLNEAKVCIDNISSEDGSIVIYPRSKNRPPYHICDMLNIYDLLLILKLLQDEYPDNL